MSGEIQALATTVWSQIGTTDGVSLGWRQMMVSALAAGLLCWASLAVLLKSGLAWRIAMDVPNQRSMHTRPTPRVGGLGLLPACLCVGAVMAPTFRLAALVALGLMLLSQIDDRRGLSARVRFAAQLVGAMLFVCISEYKEVGGLAINLTSTVSSMTHVGFLAIAITMCLVIAFVWAMNLYNFMDGIDGLAGGMAAIGFSIYAIAAFVAVHNAQLSPAADAVDAVRQHVTTLRDIALASSAIAGAAIGFLFWNAPPARLFLGDAGSVPLGFLAAGLGWLGWFYGAWPAAFPFVVFAPFAMDATATLLKRLARGDRFWEAHREHYYQRMVRMGWPRLRVLLISYGLMAIAGGGALMYQVVATSYGSSGVNMPLSRGIVPILCFIGLFGFGVVIDRRWAAYVRISSTT